MSSKRGQISQAPTPQNTPSSVSGSYLNSKTVPTIPSTIKEDDDDAAAKKMLLSNPALMSLIEGKLNTLVGEPSNYIESLPQQVKNRIYGLKSLQTKQFELEAEFQIELLELEKKFHAKYQPIFEKRKKIIEGKQEPTEEEIEKGKELMEDEEDEDDEEKIVEVGDDEEEDDEDGEKKKAEDKDVAGIPGFWLTALENLGPVADLISARDAEVLTHLTNIKMEYLDTPGFKLIFEFEENKFFSQKQLVKTYYYQKELGYSGDFIYDHAEGCDIKWSSNDDNVTIQVEKRKQRNKHTKQVRTIEKLTPIDSFFNFFAPPVPPKDDDEEEEEDEEEEDDLEQRLQLDYELGELIKDKLITRAVDWFTGDALQYEFEQGEEELDLDDDSDDEDDEDDDDYDDGDDDDEGADGAPKKELPAECKQQ
ncbi:unnamed protein product [Ambrosiozyma monospora]|uniref:Unnamed protein product n=1 Tax=Ambrosiozyma monospora TaxID=43982 RepID=A0ACB5SXK6_AMBMO|nr:unnamed protein product [Ambrosiozyma monospora]